MVNCSRTSCLLVTKSWKATQTRYFVFLAEYQVYIFDEIVDLTDEVQFSLFLIHMLRVEA